MLTLKSKLKRYGRVHWRRPNPRTFRLTTHFKDSALIATTCERACLRGCGMSRSNALSPRNSEAAFCTLSVPVSCIVPTPRPLADAMAEAMGDLPGSQWLEPCVGDGVFLESLSQL